MNKHIFIYFALGIAFTITGCNRGASRVTATINPIIPAPSLTSSPTYTATLPPTSTPTFIPTITTTPLPTLIPEQAKLAIETLMQEPVDCSAPCFWGITAGKTSYLEAKSIIKHYGLKLIFVTQLNEMEYFYTEYKFEDDFSIGINLGIQDGTVAKVRVRVHPEIQEVGKLRDWLVYSPEKLIERYGPPTKAEFAVGRGNSLSYGMVLYFDNVNLIVEYGGYDVGLGAGDSFRICPVMDQQESIRMWFGKNPENPPGSWAPLEKATSLTLDEFAQLMLGDPQKACVDLKMELFP